jgi:acyl carrier protein
MDRHDGPYVDQAQEAPSVEEVRARLILDLSRALHMQPSALDIREPIFSYGLDSLAAVTLIASLEEWLDIRLPATLPWDFPTVAALSEHLAALAREARHSPT